MSADLDDLLSALAAPTRLRALQVLWDGGEYCVCELMDRLGTTQSRMSRHMGRLKIAGLVLDRRDAQWVRYRRAPNIAPHCAAIIDAVMRALPAPSHRSDQQEAA